LSVDNRTSLSRWNKIEYGEKREIFCSETNCLGVKRGGSGGREGVWLRGLNIVREFKSHDKEKRTCIQVRVQRPTVHTYHLH
jgi:hypothetical protein